MKKIKQALENEIKQLEEDWRFAGFRRPIEDRIVALRTALSELEGSKPKELTDEGIERIIDGAFQDHENVILFMGARRALRYARDHGYLSPQPKESPRYVMSRDYKQLAALLMEHDEVEVFATSNVPNAPTPRMATMSWPISIVKNRVGVSFSTGTENVEMIWHNDVTAKKIAEVCTRLNLEWIAVEPPKEIATDEELEDAAMEVVKAAWSKSSMVDGVKLMLDYFRMWRDQGKVTINRIEPPKEQGAEPVPTAREKAMEEAINNANVSIQRLDHRDLDMHKVAMMDVDDWRAIQDAAKSTK